MLYLTNAELEKQLIRTDPCSTVDSSKWVMQHYLVCQLLMLFYTHEKEGVY